MKHDKRIVIIGGVAGGASAAARCRRLSETAEILLIERGEHISFANCGMPYHIGETIQERDRLLVQTPQGMRNRYRVNIRTQTEALRINRQERQVILKNLVSGAETAESYDELILSPGAEPAKPPIPGVESPLVLTLRSLTDMDRIKQRVDAKPDAQVIVVGGGYIGLEMAEAPGSAGFALRWSSWRPRCSSPPTRKWLRRFSSS